MKKVRTLGEKYELLVYIPVRTGTYRVHTFLLILVPTFLHFERVHTGYMLSLVEYILLVPDSIARPLGRPAGLLASDSRTGPSIEANHTQAGLLTTAPLRHPTRHALSWRGGWPVRQELLRRRPAARRRPLQLPLRRHQRLLQRQSFGV